MPQSLSKNKAKQTLVLVVKQRDQRLENWVSDRKFRP